MRFREFIKEHNVGKVSHRATRGLNTFHDGDNRDDDYTLGRVMMAAACTDGITPPDIDKSSHIGKNKSAHPYTKEEQNMLKMAYKAAGATYRDLNNNDLRSQELPETNKTSPIKGFQGYPR